VASQLLVQYFPVDLLSNVGKIIPVNQPRDVELVGIIAPASGAPCSALTKTVYFSDIAAGEAEQQQIPQWAVEYFPEVVTNFATSWDISLFRADFSLLRTSDANGVAGQFPNWQIESYWRTVPQDATIINVGVDPLQPTGLFEPSIKFKLAL